MTEVIEISADSTAHYADTLQRAAEALLKDGVEAGRKALEPIAGEIWAGTVKLSSRQKLDGIATESRGISDSLRAAVFKRDAFICSSCGGRTVPRNILVAFHDVYPESIAYHPNYKRGFTHPVFWALAPEADHIHAHSKGGGNTLENLTTLHAICNTRKSDSIAATPGIPHASQGPWDGLTSYYSTLIASGAGAARERYHHSWNRRYGV